MQVEIPIARMDSAAQIGLVPITSPKEDAGRTRRGSRNPMDPAGQVFLQDVARIHERTVPGEYDRYNMKRLMSMTANIQGEGFWGGSRAVSPTRSRRPARFLAVRDRRRARADPADAADVRCPCWGKIYEGLTAGRVLP